MNKELYELSYSLKKELKKKILLGVAFAVGIYAFINLFLAFVAFPLRQTSASMQPDIVRNSCILFTHVGKSVSRGDVVLVRSRNEEERPVAQRFFEQLVLFFTAQQFNPFNIDRSMGNEPQIRRVIGVPGDEIYVRDYVMYIKPAGEKYFLTEFELVKKSYNVEINAAPALWDTSIGVEGSFDTILLGEKEYFVLGDARNSSADSRLWGAVSEEHIAASALVQYFPLSKLRFF